MSISTTYSYNESITVSQKKSTTIKQDNDLTLSAETAKISLNASIVSSTFGNNSSIKDDPLKLLYRTAIDQINDILIAEGKTALTEETLEEKGDDFYSPEKTAERITLFATGLYGAYRDQHQDMSEEEAVNRFTQLIGSGINKGFEEARGILDGLKVLDDDIKNNVDRTYDLVFEQLDAFREKMLADKESESDTEAANN